MVIIPFSVLTECSYESYIVARSSERPDEAWADTQRRLMLPIQEVRGL